MTTFRHILAPVDFGAPSERALELATDLASTFGTKLTVFHAWDLPANAYAGMLYLSPQIWDTLGQAAAQQLDTAVARVRGRLPGAESMLVRGPAAVEILAAIERTGADLVVIGTHGRQGLSRFLLGSVAEKVLRASSVPVLTVRGEIPAS